MILGIPTCAHIHCYEGHNKVVLDFDFKPVDNCFHMDPYFCCVHTTGCKL